ncbi:MAG TPA: M3 family metallopeptidase [Xanthomonadales bacterium]|nr:M3 family metallopeptidase [Xanthomonadales bacterium]
MHPRMIAPLALLASLSLLGCSNDESTSPADGQATAPTAPAADTDSNPFYAASELYFNYPPFDRIETRHFRPAYEQGMQEQLAEIEAIANNPEPPDFENTLAALERSGRVLDRVDRVFSALVSAHTNDQLEEIRSEMAPRLSAHNDQILLNGDLFKRIQAIAEARDSLELDPESYRLAGKYYEDFVRAGALLSDEDKERLKAMNSELASLQTTFSQNVLNEVNDSAVVVDTVEELAGLSEDAIAAAASAAADRDLEGKYVITLLNTTGQPPLAKLENRALRERIYQASIARGNRGGEYDNRAVLSKILKLRAERAQLLGYENHAAYSLENQTARTVEAVNERLASLGPAAAANARREAEELQALIDAEGGDFELAPWDWAYYTEKLRKAKYDFDEAELEPYLELDNVLINGVFYAAGQVFGLSFKERTDEFPVYLEGVRVWEVFDADGTPLAMFIGDFYARPSKRGGAWMNAYVSQSKLLGLRPVVANHQNITKPTGDEPTLMTWDEVTTMFHEFGHALHGMFSDVTYPYFSGTSVPRDFVEYPSQVNEMWSVWPEVLENYALHHETGEPMPQELLDKILATQKFNQGFATTEALAAAILDQALHQLKPEEVPDADSLMDFEAQALTEAGMAVPAVPPRYRSTYFSHIIGGYSAGYYSYIWSEVLDADTVEWFKENGGMTRANGDHFRRTLLSRGGSVDAMQLFRDFRGREPDIAPLLERRGLN